MPVYNIGRERESLMFSGEAYKRAVRKYLESQGFSETTDSYVEGHLQDMIFYNRDIEPGREFWIEAKGKKVSLSQKDFCKELLEMLEIWLYLTPAQRFKLKIFVQEVFKRRNWDLLFQSPIDKEYFNQWLERAKTHVSDAIFQKIEDKSNDEKYSFFQEIEVFIGPGYKLEIAAEEKLKTSALSPSRKAESLLAESERRNVLVEQKTSIIMNLMEIELPDKYVRVELKVKSIEEIWDGLKGSVVPPFAFDGRFLYSFVLPDCLDQLSGIFKKKPEILNVEDLIKENPQKVSQMLNFHLDKLARCRGLRKYRNLHFFIPKYNDSGDVEERYEKSVTGKLKRVTRPMFETVETEEVGISESLNFVFHWGIIIESKYLWNKFFVQILPVRHFTTDGKFSLTSESKKRLERKYRNPLYNRNTKFLSWTLFWKFYLFDSPLNNPEFSNWYRDFRFGKLIETSVIGSPESINKDQRMITKYGDDEDDD